MGLKGFLFIAFGFMASFSWGQEELIKRRQRAIFIYNFTQQLSWSNSEEFEEFTIGVMGDDPLVQELEKMRSEGRTVYGKPIKVVGFKSIREIENAQLVYAHKRYNFDINRILDKVRGKNTLVVCENYGFNESMINMIDIDDSFQFEINESKLSQEQFTVSPSLQRLAIDSEDRWQALYLESKKSLEEERETVAEQRERLIKQEALLQQQHNQIAAQLEQIDARNIEVERLRVEYEGLAEKNEEQQKLFLENEQSLQQVSDSLDSQRQGLEQRKEEVDRLDRILLEQMNLLSEQEEEIDSQNQVLRQQRAALNYQRNFTILFVILTISTITAGVFIWRSYRIKKRSSEELEKKNKSIEAKSRKLEAQNEEMEQFAYVASHDLQEPLNTISSIVNLINVDKLDDVGKNSFQFIGDSTERMRQLIRGLLEYSKLGQDVAFERVDCNKILENVQANLSKVIADTGTKLEANELPVVKGHEVKLSLLFQNLISNAIKFRKEDEQPLIRVRAEKYKKGKKGSFWKFSISDNGIGIEDKHKNKVFAIFQRLHPKSKYEGTGIGLAHCKKIVDLHGGSIWVESELGKGSTFFFTISN